MANASGSRATLDDKALTHRFADDISVLRSSEHGVLPDGLKIESEPNVGIVLTMKNRAAYRS